MEKEDKTRPENKLRPENRQSLFIVEEDGCVFVAPEKWFKAWDKNHSFAIKHAGSVIVLKDGVVVKDLFQGHTSEKIYEELDKPWWDAIAARVNKLVNTDYPDHEPTEEDNARMAKIINEVKKLTAELKSKK